VVGVERVAANLHHVTSATGDVATTARADVSDRVVALLRPLVAAGGGQVPGVPEWHLDVLDRQPGMAVFQVARGPATSPAGKRPYVVAVGCWSEDASAAAWRDAHMVARMTLPGAPNRLPEDPPAVPWLSVTPGVGLLLLPPERVGMLGDFERCVLWTLAEDLPEVGPGASAAPPGLRGPRRRRGP
jgi:hypothetical protein